MLRSFFSPPVLVREALRALTTAACWLESSVQGRRRRGRRLLICVLLLLLLMLKVAQFVLLLLQITDARETLVEEPIAPETKRKKIFSFEDNVGWIY